MRTEKVSLDLELRSHGDVQLRGQNSDVGVLNTYERPWRPTRHIITSSVPLGSAQGSRLDPTLPGGAAGRPGPQGHLGSRCRAEADPGAGRPGLGKRMAHGAGPGGGPAPPPPQNPHLTPGGNRPASSGGCAP